MSKPFNFEDFKVGKPAMLKGNKIEFIAYDEDLNFPVLCKETEGGIYVLHQCSIKYLQVNATMLPTKRTVWIAIIKENQNGRIMPTHHLYDSKEQALQYRAAMWKVIDAIPYEIEE